MRVANTVAAVFLLVGLAFLITVAVYYEFPFVPTACLIVAFGCSAPQCVRIIVAENR
jgi:hypothetical protein